LGESCPKKNEKTWENQGENMGKTMGKAYSSLPKS
jgi:hypothetical protein